MADPWTEEDVVTLSKAAVTAVWGPLCPAGLNDLAFVEAVLRAAAERGLLADPGMRCVAQIVDETANELASDSDTDELLDRMVSRLGPILKLRARARAIRAQESEG